MLLYCEVIERAQKVKQFLWKASGQYQRNINHLCMQNGFCIAHSLYLCDTKHSSLGCMWELHCRFGSILFCSTTSCNIVIISKWYIRIWHIRIWHYEILRNPISPSFNACIRSFAQVSLISAWITAWLEGVLHTKPCLNSGIWINITCQKISSISCKWISRFHTYLQLLRILIQCSLTDKASPLLCSILPYQKLAADG